LAARSLLHAGPCLHAAVIRIAPQVYINSNATFLDVCPITIGSRTLIGPNCSFFAATHPIDPFVRNGLNGPELGKPITIGEDCWFGGNVTVLPGVTIGRGVTVGAGSVVTKDVEDFVVVAGNPARVVKRLNVADKIKGEGKTQDSRYTMSC
jgi:acetyltransferase-like isoleucine patch superfamily enzyme